MISHICSKKIFFLVCLGVLFVSVRASAEYEAVAHVVKWFGGTGECCSNCATLQYAYDKRDGWNDGFDYIGYGQTPKYHDYQVDGRDWTNYSSTHTWGRDYVDPWGVDFADAAFYSGHGGRHCDGGPYYSHLVMGDNNASETCYVRTDSHMKFGSTSDPNKELDVLVQHACQTAHKCVWENGGYDGLNNGSPNGSTGYSFKMILGFHGITYSTSYTGTAIKNYVKYSRSNGIGDDWVDRFTETFGQDRCATAIVFGSNSAVRGTFYQSAGYKDLKSVGNYNGTSYYYIGGCNPSGGESL